MFFNKKKQEPKEPKKKRDVLKKELMQKTDINTSSIILKIAKKREELYHLDKVPEDRKEEVDTRFENMVLFLKKINWEQNINEALSNACLQDINGVFQPDFPDPNTVKFLLNITWQDIKVEMNRMINDLLMLIEEMET